MTKLTPEETKTIAPLADRQMKRWALSMQAQERLAPQQALERLPEEVHPYLAISREAGSGGSELGRLVAERLGHECLDKQLLTYLAERYELPSGLLDLVDEKTVGWIREVFLHWLNKRVITQDEYLLRLGQLALVATHHASTVFIGRGVQFLLPRDRGLAVRIIAPLEARIARTMERRKLGREAAEDHVRETDEGRAFMIKRHFHKDIGDPHLYDLVVSLEHLDHAAAANVIADAFRHRFPTTTA